MAGLALSPAALAALFSLGAIAVAVILVAALHRLEPEFDPSWRMLSEYVLGRYGVIMRLAFLCGGAGVMASGLALWQPVGFFALGLVVVALGPIGAAFIDTDPITTPRSELSLRSKVHAGLGSLFILGFPVAATCAGLGAAITSPAGVVLAWTAIVPWAGLGWFLAATLQHGRTVAVGQPDLPIGWPIRFNMLAYLAWVAVADVLMLTRTL